MLKILVYIVVNSGKSFLQKKDQIFYGTIYIFFLFAESCTQWQIAVYNIGFSQ